MDKDNPFIKTLCQAGDKGDCNAILNSKAAQITSWLSWSEVGFFYFAGSFIGLIINPSSIILIQVIGLFAIFYTFWSIYYQGFLIKQWCTFCLIIQALLCIEFSLSISGVLPKVNNNTLNILIIGLLNQGTIIISCLLELGFIIIFWILIKPIFKQSQQSKSLKDELSRIKNNPDFFLGLLQKQAEMPFVTRTMNTTIIGPYHAKHTITLITNPICQPCEKAHKTIEHLLALHEGLNCQVIFSASNKETDQRGVIARTILSLPKSQQGEALHDWYKSDEKSIYKWQQKLGVIENNEAKTIIEQQQIWCELAQVTSTPTMYFNGFKIPELYQVEDLKYVLNYLPKTDLQIENK